MTFAGPGFYRIFLAALVVLNHLSSLPTGQPAVWMFFVLSGYWIARMWDSEYQNKDWTTSYTEYMILRIIRIYPLYIISLLFMILVVRISQDSSSGYSYNDIIRNIFLIGLTFAPHNITGVGWSLDIEMQFYFTAPFILIFIKMKYLFFILVFCIIFFILNIIQLAQSPDLRSQLFIYYLGYFIAGAAFWRLHWSPTRPAIFLSVGAGLSIIVSVEFALYIYKLDQSFVLLTTLQTLFVVCCLPLTAAILNIKSNILDRHIGNISYSVYLFHFPIRLLMFDQKSASMSMKISYLCIVILISIIIYYTLDYQIEKYRKRLSISFSRGKPKIAQPRSDGICTHGETTPVTDGN